MDLQVIAEINTGYRPPDELHHLLCTLTGKDVPASVAVVTTDVPAHTIVAGVPAKVVGSV